MTKCYSYISSSLPLTVAETKTSGGRQGRRNRVSLQACPLIQLFQYHISRTHGEYTRPISRPCSPRRGILTCLSPWSYSTIFPLPPVRYAACCVSMVKGPTQKITLFLPRGVFKLYTLFCQPLQAVRRPLCSPFINYSIHLQVRAVKTSERCSRNPVTESASDIIKTKCILH